MFTTCKACSVTRISHFLILHLQFSISHLAFSILHLVFSSRIFYRIFHIFYLASQIFISHLVFFLSCISHFLFRNSYFLSRMSHFYLELSLDFKISSRIYLLSRMSLTDFRTRFMDINIVCSLPLTFEDYWLAALKQTKTNFSFPFEIGLLSEEYNSAKKKKKIRLRHFRRLTNSRTGK